MNIKRHGTYKMKGLLVFISLSVVYPGKITDSLLDSSVLLLTLLFSSRQADRAKLALCKISSAGGTGSTTGAELTEHLFRRTTSMGPLALFRWIWYLAGQFWTCTKEEEAHINHPRLN